MVQNNLYKVSWKLTHLLSSIQNQEIVSAPDETQALTAIKKRLKNRKDLSQFDIEKGEFSFQKTPVIGSSSFR